VTRVVFLLVPGLHLLDLAGPAQVFSSAGDLGLPYELMYVAEVPEVTTPQGLPVRAQTDLPVLGPRDVLVVPGWRGSGCPLTERTLRWIGAHTGTVASVCAGAFALARAGVRDVLYVVDGRVVTSAGIASGIDLALHLVATWHGPAVAARIARVMVVYARRNGDEAQNSALMRYRSHVNDTVHRIQDVIESRLAERLPLVDLARECDCSERTVTRLFTQATGMTPLRYQQVLRVERAEHLMATGATAEAAARAVGFGDGRMLRRLRARPS